MKKKIIYFIRKPRQLFIVFLYQFPKFRFIKHLSDTEEPVTFKLWWEQKIKGYNKKAYWPMHKNSKVVGIENILIGIGTNPGMNPGCYIQGTGKLIIGNYCLFGPNVGLLSGNHDMYNQRKYISDKTTQLGDYCWIGMNSVILPNVKLGDFTIVAAGSVVSRSFKKGYCVIGGNPAQLLYKIDPKKCVKYKNTHEYHGYIPKHKFERYRKKFLSI